MGHCLTAIHRHCPRKGGFFIAKQRNGFEEGIDTKENTDTKESSNTKDSPKQIYGRVFKRIFSLSDKAIIHLINGLFGKNFPLDSTVEYPNRKFVLPSLVSRLVDIIVVIAGIYVFHLEAQMDKDEMVVLRVFEYGFQYAMSAQKDFYRLDFPEPAVIYLNRIRGIPEESVLHIHFEGQGSFDYHEEGSKCEAFLSMLPDDLPMNRR